MATEQALKPGHHHHGQQPASYPHAVPPPTGPYATGVPIIVEGGNDGILGPRMRPESRTASICAWLLFILGFFFPIAWLFVLCLPFMYGNRSIKGLATASLVLLIIYIFFLVIFTPLYVRQ
jgi:hypothetical protein